MRRSYAVQQSLATSCPKAPAVLYACNINISSDGRAPADRQGYDASNIPIDSLDDYGNRPELGFGPLQNALKLYTLALQRWQCPAALTRKYGIVKSRRLCGWSLTVLECSGRIVLGCLQAVHQQDR